MDQICQFDETTVIDIHVSHFTKTKLRGILLSILIMCIYPNLPWANRWAPYPCFNNFAKLTKTNINGATSIRTNWARWCWKDLKELYNLGWLYETFIFLIFLESQIFLVLEHFLLFSNIFVTPKSLESLRS